MANTVPPRYASVHFSPDTPYCWVTGPLSEEQLLDSLAAGSDESSSEGGQREWGESPFGYAVEPDDIGYKGEYPGGRARLALNLARLVLGA